MINETKMTELEKLDYAILKTMEVHKNADPVYLIEAILFLDNFLMYITSSGRARDIMSSLSKETVIKEITKQALKVSMLSSDERPIPGARECINFLKCLKACQIKGKDILPFLKENPPILESIAKSFVELRYKNRNFVDLKYLDNFSHRAISDYLYHLKDKTDILSRAKIFNIKMASRINECREDIIKGVQLQKGNVKYSLGNAMFASSLIGKRKKTQEDSVLLIEHPNNRDFKMLVIADGVGGHGKGDEASSYTVRKILSWFERINPKYFEESDRILSKLEKELVKINVSLNSKKDRRATTFLCGIVGKKETIVASIGDSRAYITKNNELQQVSRDDSLVQEYYENGYIRTKDDMRFHYKSNHITNCLGANDDFSLNYYVLDNSQYDTLILVSDGVSDCLSDSQIMAITAQTPKEEIANALVMAANRTNSHRQKQSYETYYYEDIYGGKDNTTAAIYHNRK